LQTDILEAATQGVNGLLHLAALWSLHCHEFSRSPFDVNVSDTFNVMEACTKAGVKQRAYSSSPSVYGYAISEPKTEDHSFGNKNFYGSTKICGEAMLRSFHHRYRLGNVGLRYMNVHDPRQDYPGAYIAVIMKMLDAVDCGESPAILGDGSEAFDFVAVEACAQANVCAMMANATDSFCNVGTGIRISLKQLAELLRKLTGSTQPIHYAPRSQSTLVRNRIGCPQKAYAEIGYTPAIELREGLQHLIDLRASHKAEVEALRGAQRLVA